MRARVLFRVTNTPRFDSAERVARIVAPAGVGGAQFIQNNYRGDTGKLRAYLGRGWRGSLFRGADVSTLINRPLL